MTRIVEVAIKSVYGKEAIYPVGSTAKLFADLTGKKTLSRQDIETIRLLGFEVKQVQLTEI
jgi:histone H3/H4